MKVFVYQLPRSGAENLLNTLRRLGLPVCAHDFPQMHEEIISGRFNFQTIRANAGIVSGLPITAHYRQIIEHFPQALHVYCGVGDRADYCRRLRTLLVYQRNLQLRRSRHSGKEQATQEANERLLLARSYFNRLFGEWPSYSDWWIRLCVQHYEYRLRARARKQGIQLVECLPDVDVQQFLKDHQIVEKLETQVIRIKHRVRSLVGRGISYAASRNEFVGAGRPQRTPEMVKEIHDTHCQPCPHFQPDTSRCGLCSCFVHDGSLSLPNKLLYATTRCPDKPPRWRQSTMDPRTFNNRTPPEILADTFFRTGQPFRDSLPANFADWKNLAEAFRTMYQRACDYPLAQPHWTHERGIVICGGGWKFYPGIYVTARLLREVLGCTLPIQVWYLGARREFDQRMQQALQPYDVGWVDADQFVRDNENIHMGILGGWESKPLAAAYAPFREVVFMDADCYPVYDPARFLDHPEFRRVGAAFWPDGQKLERGQWDRFGVPYHDEYAWESGQFCIDKSRHWKPLQLTLFMNSHSDYVYKHIYGDKDTFHLSWRKAAHEVCVPHQHALWHSVAFRCNDFAGDWLFVHRTRDKWKLAGLVDGQPPPRDYFTSQHTKDSNRYIDDMPHEKACHHFLREARKAIDVLSSPLHFDDYRQQDHNPNGSPPSA